jgi:hypothetical protein
MITTSFQNVASDIFGQLGEKGFAVVDGFLYPSMCADMRLEAAALLQQGRLEASQVTGWDHEAARSVAQAEPGVFRMQLDGGDDYFTAPRLHELVVALVRTAAPLFGEEYPAAQLCSQYAANSLVATLGEGAGRAKRCDNGGLDDRRKLAFVYFLGPGVSVPGGGGECRLYSSQLSTGGAAAEAVIAGVNAGVDADGHSYCDVSPSADRLLVYWADRQIHRTNPMTPKQVAAEAGGGVVAEDSPQEVHVSEEVDADHALQQFSLTVWLSSITTDAIVAPSDEELARHF